MLCHHRQRQHQPVWLQHEELRDRLLLRCITRTTSCLCPIRASSRCLTIHSTSACNWHILESSARSLQRRLVVGGDVLPPARLPTRSLHQLQRSVAELRELGATECIHFLFTPSGVLKNANSIACTVPGHYARRRVRCGAQTDCELVTACSGRRASPADDAGQVHRAQHGQPKHAHRHPGLHAGLGAARGCVQQS